MAIKSVRPVKANAIAFCGTGQIQIATCLRANHARHALRPIRAIEKKPALNNNGEARSSRTLPQVADAFNEVDLFRVSEDTVQSGVLCFQGKLAGLRAIRDGLGAGNRDPCKCLKSQSEQDSRASGVPHGSASRLPSSLHDWNFAPPGKRRRILPTPAVPLPYSYLGTWVPPPAEPTWKIAFASQSETMAFLRELRNAC